MSISFPNTRQEKLPNPHVSPSQLKISTKLLLAFFLLLVEQSKRIVRLSPGSGVWINNSINWTQISEQVNLVPKFGKSKAISYIFVDDNMLIQSGIKGKWIMNPISFYPMVQIHNKNVWNHLMTIKHCDNPSNNHLIVTVQQRPQNRR